MKENLQTALSLIALLILSGAILGWGRAVLQLRQGQPLVAWRRRPLVPWGIIDLLLLIAVFAVVHVLAAWTVREIFQIAPPPDAADLMLHAEVHWATAAAHFLWMAIAAAALIGIRGATADDLGISGNIGRDLWLGVKAFVMLAPLVYLLQFILVQFWPSHHPLVDALRQQATPQLLLAGAVTAVVAAPLFEEFAFRVLLQGSFERVVAMVYVQFKSLPPATTSADKATSESPHEDSSRDDSFTATPAADPTTTDPYTSPSAPVMQPDEPTTPPRWNELVPWPWRLLPILGSGTVFALMHFDHGPDWMPLLILGIGLGYLYQRTGRILPCITVHFLLNANSYGILLMELME